MIAKKQNMERFRRRNVVFRHLVYYFAVLSSANDKNRFGRLELIQIHELVF